LTPNLTRSYNGFTNGWSVERTERSGLVEKNILRIGEWKNEEE
jgi:hypothetical protein